jgi:hypothetical protein
MNVHDLVEKLIENSTNGTGSRMLRIISIYHDDHGMGIKEEREQNKKEEKKERNMRKEKHDDTENRLEERDENHIEPITQKSKEEDNITEDEEFESDYVMIQYSSINAVDDIKENESKNTDNNADSTYIRWTRCLITIEKTEITANTINDTIINTNNKTKNEENDFTCLPNIFDDKKNKKTSMSSEEFDKCILPGFRKELFKATWKGGER